MGLRNVVYEVFNDFQGYMVLSPGLSGDNTAANMLSSNSSGTRSARHLSLQNFYVRGLAIRGLATFKQIPSATNVSDILTKVVPRELLEKLLELIKCYSC